MAVATLALPAALLVGAPTAASAAGPVYTQLTLVNGWQRAGDVYPQVAVISGVVTFRGEAYGGTSPTMFTLPKKFRPTSTVFAAASLPDSGTGSGRLVISPSGLVTVQAEGNATGFYSFTSLDGVSFAQTEKGFTPLTLLNSWQNTSYGTARAAARVISGIVHLRGAIANGVAAEPFVLPTKFRPAHEVYVPVDLCNATNGRLHVSPNGTVVIEAQSSFSNAQCFTSLDGVSFALPAASSTPLTLRGGWAGSPYGTGAPTIAVINGVVHLSGALYCAGTCSHDVITMTDATVSDPPFAYQVKVDLCNATPGTLDLGIWENDDSSLTPAAWVGSAELPSASCFLSLDGVTYVPR
jgi:hypothetical protein